MIDFTKNDDLNKIISDNDIAIIQYGTATCMPCHSIKNRITTWQEDHKDVVAYYISLEEFSKAVSEYIDYYNNKRIQSKTKWMPPVQYRITSTCLN